METHKNLAGEITTLESYGTRVATYSHYDNTIEIYPNPKEGGDKTYSNTTRAHINAFLVYFGFDKCSKKEMEKYFA